MSRNCVEIEYKGKSYFVRYFGRSETQAWHVSAVLSNGKTRTLWLNDGTREKSFNVAAVCAIANEKRREQREAETVKPEAETVKPEAETVKPEAETVKPEPATISDARVVLEIMKLETHATLVDCRLSDAEELPASGLTEAGLVLDGWQANESPAETARRIMARRHATDTRYGVR